MKFDRLEYYLANKNIVLGILAVLALIVYHDSINHEFIIYDDHIYLGGIIKNDSGFWSLINYSFTM